MGADLLLCWTPFCGDTPERREEFKRSLRKLSDAELVDECKDTLDWLIEDSESDTEAAEAIRDTMLQAFREYGENRECCSISFPGMDYEMLITGGMSWGDRPTESFREVEILGAVPADTYRLLEKWAKEDFAARMARKPMLIGA